MSWASQGQYGGYGWSAGIQGIGTAGYQYGSDADFGVVAHWTFTEAGSPLVDTKSGIQVAATNAPTAYQAYGTGMWANFAGVTFGAGHFKKTTATTELNIGASEHMVVEFVGSAPASYTSGSSPVFRILGTHDTVIMFSAPNQMLVDLWMDSGAESYAYLTTTAINDDQNHKYRLVCDRAGVCELFLDGYSQGSFSLAAISGASVTCNAIAVGGYNNDALGWVGTMRELRITKNSSATILSTNSGGPNGG